MQLRENRNMNIDSETARIAYLPQSHLFAYLEDAYENEIDWRVNGSPHEETAANLVAALEADQFDPLEPDWSGPEDSQLTPMWADLGFPLPADADELAHEAYGITASDMARQALREYANLFDIEATAEALLKRLRAEYDRQNSNHNN